MNDDKKTTSYSDIVNNSGFFDDNATDSSVVSGTIDMLNFRNSVTDGVSIKNAINSPSPYSMYTRNSITNYNTSGISPHSHDFTANVSFSKTRFLECVTKGMTVKQSVNQMLRELSSCGVVEMYGFLEQFGLMDASLFWEIVYKSEILYILGQRFHTVEDCVDFLAYFGVRSMIECTDNKILCNKDFCRKINALKLKGVF